MKKSVTKKRTTIITVAVLLSIILYLAGVYSGLNASKIIKLQTEKDIESIKQESKEDISQLKTETQKDLETTQADIEFLQNYLGLLEKKIRTMQLEQSFVETLSHDEMCNFTSITMNGLLRDLSIFWQKLPFRIEEFEKNNPLTEEYLTLKQQYTQESIQTWILAKNTYKQCDNNLVPGLYFYSAQCPNCINQGKELDDLQRINITDEKRFLVFTVDFNSEDAMVQYLKQYYNVFETPALIIDERVFQGRIFESDELLQVIK